jgi:pimeloyl-ACP methyl ester carboxylesterase
MLNRKPFCVEDGTKIWYGLQGAGPTLVLCDGLGCDGYVWPYIMDHFDERFTVVRWHYRGHGRSDDPQDLSTLSIPRFVEDLRALLHHLRDEGKLTLPALLAGHSMGCQVILEYATRHPDEVRALVPICGSYGRPLDTFQGKGAFRPVFEKALAWVEKYPNASEAVWRQGFRSPFGWSIASRTEINPALVMRSDFEPYLRHMGRIKARVFLRTLLAVADHDAGPNLGQLQTPALIFAGKKDRFTPMHLSERMARELPHARLVVLEEGTHTAPLEVPEQINVELDAFFKEQGLLD